MRPSASSPDVLYGGRPCDGELRDSPIKVNSACPGYVATDLNQHRGVRTVEQGAAIIVRLSARSPRRSSASRSLKESFREGLIQPSSRSFDDQLNAIGLAVGLDPRHTCQLLRRGSLVQDDVQDSLGGIHDSHPAQLPCDWVRSGR